MSNCEISFIPLFHFSHTSYINKSSDVFGGTFSVPIKKIYITIVIFHELYVTLGGGTVGGMGVYIILLFRSKSILP